MGEKDALTKKADKEEKRLRKMLQEASVSYERIELLRPVIRNVAWMKAQLDDTREVIKDTKVAIPYDNGGGQTGIRENPLFKGYEALWKSYMAGMNKILEALPTEADVAEEEAKPQTVLSLIRAKHEA